MLGLTVIFSVSGIAVNHTHDWNPNYSISHSTLNFTSVAPHDEQIVLKELIKSFKITEKFKASFAESPDSTKFFFHDDLTIRVNSKQNTVEIEKINKRFLLHSFNRLHLNNIKSYWTYISDLFALAMLFFAFSALFMVRGKKGAMGRGGIFILIGILTPVLVLSFS